jgi:hypothetical protein
VGEGCPGLRGADQATNGDLIAEILTTVAPFDEWPGHGAWRPARPLHVAPLPLRSAHCPASPDQRVSQPPRSTHRIIPAARQPYQVDDADRSGLPVSADRASAWWSRCPAPPSCACRRCLVVVSTRRIRPPPVWGCCALSLRWRAGRLTALGVHGDVVAAAGSAAAASVVRFFD